MLTPAWLVGTEPRLCKLCGSLLIEEQAISATGRLTTLIWASSRRALELEPYSEEALSALGSAYLELGDPDRAEATLRRAVALRPGWWTGHNALGVFYYRQGRYDDAAEQFRRVLVLTPDNSRGWSNLGGIHYMAGRIDEGHRCARAVGRAVTHGGRPIQHRRLLRHRPRRSRRVRSTRSGPVDPSGHCTDGSWR